MPDYPKILLKFYCDQNVEEMPLVENGSQRYCEQCNRNLIDFRNHSMEAIQEYKRTRKGEKFCGIFPSNYVQPEILIQPRYEAPKSLFSNSLMVLAALSLLTACQHQEEDRTTGEPIEETEIIESDTNSLSSSNTDSTEADSTKKCIPEKLHPIPPGIDPVPPFVGIEMEPEPPSSPEIPDATTIEQQDEIHSIVEKMPEFPGGEIKMMEFLKNEIKYPEFAKEKNLQGTVYVRFVVNENGEVTDPVILKTPDKIFDEPTLSVIRRMPRWIPGEQSGKKVKVYVNLPIRYKL